jgi:PAS domain S-box-containing protein
MPERARARAAAALRRDAALEAVAFAAQRFLETPEWETIVPQVLRRLGDATGVSRVQVSENRADDEGRVRVTLRHEWTADGIRPVIGDPAVTDAPFDDGSGRWPAILGRGDLIHGLVHDFPVSEQAELLARGVRSVLAVPIFVDQEWWGHVGFDDCAADRIWSQVEIDALRAVAGTIGAAISRRRVEEQLRDAENSFRELVERIPAITYRQRSDGDPEHFYISPLVEDMLGYTPDQWTWTPDFWIDRVHPDDRARVAKADEETDRSGEPCDLEYRLRRADGGYVWVHDQATRLVREDGSAFWLGFIQDVTERRRAQDALEKAEARYRALVEHIPGVTYREQQDGTEGSLYLSPQVETMFGYPLAEWGGSMSFWRGHIHPDDVERVCETSDRCDRTGEPFAIEYRFRRSDGTYRWVHDEATRIGDGDGPGFWQGFMLDVTGRREAEDALQETEAKYRALVEQVPAAIYTQVIDEDDPRISKTLYMSPQTEEILGYTAEESVADPELWRKIVHPADRATVVAADAATNASGEPFRLEYRVVAKDGRIVWIRDEASLVRDADGNPRFWQGFMLDVTERKRAEEQIEHALDVEREATRRLRALDEMKNTFLQAVSHDLRTPLAAILGLALTLERADLPLRPDEIHDLAGRIAGNARKLERLVTDLLDLDRLLRGNVEPKLKPIDIGALVRTIVGDSDLMQEGRVTVQAPSLVANVDAAKVERIVENLLSNTMRHTPPQTHVWVRLEHATGGVLLTVEDDGPGVPVEHRTSVFEPFRQGPGVPEHSPGVGVGLALVARFAQLHRGRAWVADRQGGGASFRVFLSDGSRPAGTATAAG